MKYFILGLLLVSCNYNPENLKYGDTVKITDGLYQGFTGKIIDEITWLYPCQHSFFVEFHDRNIGTKYVSVCDLEKGDK